MRTWSKVVVVIGCLFIASNLLSLAADIAKPRSLKIAMIAKSSTNPVVLSARTGAEAAARELSARHNVAVTIDWRTPPTEDGQEQARRVAQSVNEGADAILIS